MAIAAHHLFFPAAMLQAMAAVGVWIFAPPGFATPFWHAHELIFGYALAVAAGFLFTKATPRTILVALALWTAARLAWFLPPDPFALPRAVLTMAATGTIAIIGARGFLRGIKRGQNYVFPVPLAVLLLCEATSQVPAVGGSPQIGAAAVMVAVFAVVGLILAMGGRILGAALSGLVQRSGGERLPPRPGLELAILATLLATALALLAGAPAALLACCAWMGCAAILARLADWRAGLRLASVDLLALVLAQAFIAGGLAGLGARVLDPPWPESAPLHLITIGGIGLTTVTMMVKTAVQRDRRPMPVGVVGATTALLSFAALARAGVFLSPDIAFPLAALAWIGAMAIALAWSVAARADG